MPAQVVDVRPATPPPAPPSADVLRDALEQFERYRRSRLPTWSGSPQNMPCHERIGRYCYWYDEDEPDPPPEPVSIVTARDRLIARLDSAGNAWPDDKWIAGQRVRYLVEARRVDDAVQAARQCTVEAWWCPALQGFALHAAARHVAADSAFERALALMTPQQRCAWRDVRLIIDESLRGRYVDMSCTVREALESRVWWLARPMLSSVANDARAEHYARRVMAMLLEDTPSPYEDRFDHDEEELLLRYGWPYAWSKDYAGGINSGGMDINVVGHERRPAYPLVPPRAVLESPATSDSLVWRGQVERVQARYAPPYARRLVPLEHQAGRFRRGDSSLVVVAWSVGGDATLSAAAEEPGALRAGFVLTAGEPADAVVVRRPDPGTHGTFMATFPGDSVLMSTEIVAPSDSTLARARYGLTPRVGPGLGFHMSDFVLFEPSGELPESLEEVVPRLRTNERLPEGSRVGIYWETYAASPTPVPIEVSLTVANVGSSGGWWQRTLRALRLSREARPITMGLQDVVRPGEAFTPRAMVVDLSPLRPGRFVIELELTTQSGAVVRVERPITIVAPR